MTEWLLFWRLPTISATGAARAALLLNAALISTGCQKVPELPRHDASTYRFLLGPKPDVTGGINRRVMVEVPSRFIEFDREPGEKPIELSEFTFAFRYPEAEPVKRDELAQRDVVNATFGWEPPGSVRQRIDGSWLNYYSRYKVKKASRLGLNSAVGDDGIDTSILLYSVDQSVLIECKRVRNESLRGCHLMTNLASSVIIEARFSAELLPNWKDIVKQASSLVKFSD